MSIRRYILIYALAFAAPAFALAVSCAAKAETTLNLGISGLSEGKLAIYVAQQRGFLKQAGLDVDFTDFDSGGAVVQAFLGGGIDFCICAADHVIVLHNRGIDVKILVALDAHTPDALATRSDSKITDLASLKGGKIGITSPGSSTDNLIRWALRKAGLDPENDVQLVSVGTGPPMRAAILGGAVDAGILGNAELIDTKLSGIDLKVAADFRTIPNAQLNVIARQAWVDKNKAIATDFVKAVMKGARLIQSDPAAAEAGIKVIFPGKSEEFYKALVASAAEHLSKDGVVDPQAFENVQEILSLADPDTKRVQLSDVDLQPELAR